MRNDLEVYRPTYKTDNISGFERHPLNRNEKRVALKNLTNAMQKSNDLEFWPIKVDPLLRVVDGWHRFLAAKQNNVPVLYQIYNHDECNRILKNQSVGAGKWNTKDDLNQEIQRGNENCIKLQQYMNQENIDLGTAIITLYGVCLSGFNSIGGFRTLIFPDDITLCKRNNLRDCALQLVDYLSNKALDKERKYIKTKRFYQALVLFLGMDGITFEKFYECLIEHHSKVGNRPNIESYLDLFKILYNSKLRKKNRYEFD